MIEMELIKRMYGTRTTKRSGVPLMNHITEGVKIMEDRGFYSLSIRAFIVHPLFQRDDDLLAWGAGENELSHSVIILAMEYRRVANSWLSHKPKPQPIEWGPFEPYLREMLIADKLQNYKDFLLYHQNHERYKILNQYFLDWLDELKVNI